MGKGQNNLLISFPNLKVKTVSVSYFDKQFSDQNIGHDKLIFFYR